MSKTISLRLEVGERVTFSLLETTKTRLLHSADIKFLKSSMWNEHSFYEMCASAIKQLVQEAEEENAEQAAGEARSFMARFQKP